MTGIYRKYKINIMLKPYVYNCGMDEANIVKAVGQDELVRKIGRSTKTIESKLLQDLVERT